MPFGVKLGIVEKAVGDDFFLMGRQISLDVRSIPRVLAGTKYDGWMKAGEWNDWLKGADWAAHFKQDDVNNLLLPAEQPDVVRSPAVNVPGGMEQARGLVIRDLNFVFPFGLLMIALRFVLRALLAISGHVRVDPDAAHEEDDVHERHLLDGNAAGRVRDREDLVSASTSQPENSLGAKIGLGVVGAVVVAIGATAGLLAAAVVALALLGTPLFAIMARCERARVALPPRRDVPPPCATSRPPSSTSASPTRRSSSPSRSSRSSATSWPKSKTPDCIVRASSAFFGWMPGGLPVIDRVHRRERVLHDTHRRQRRHDRRHRRHCLYPALRKQGYKDAFSLGLVTTGGSLGLLLPPSLPILVYSLVAGIDFNKTFKAGLVPGLLVMVLPPRIYAAYVGAKEGVEARVAAPRRDAQRRRSGSLGRELLIPVIILGGLGSGLTSLDESAGLAALFSTRSRSRCGSTRTLSLRKDLPRIAKAVSMGLSGRRHPHPGDGTTRSIQLRHPGDDPREGARLHAEGWGSIRRGSS